MKKFLSLFLTFSLLFAVLAASPMHVSAASNSARDGLEVSVLTDKDTYTAGEEVLFFVSIRNTNPYAVDGISLKTFLPEGINIKDGNSSFEHISIPAGDTYKTTITTAESNPVKDPEGEDSEKEEDSASLNGSNADNSSKPETAAKPESDKEADVSESEKASESGETSKAEGSGSQKVDSANTGDDFGSLWWIVLFAASAAGFLFAVKNRKAAKILSLLLCFAMIFSVIPMEVFAAEPQNSIEASKTINVDGKDYVIRARVEWDAVEIQTPVVDDSTFTRGEWITLLAEKLGIEENTQIMESSYFYGDSVDSAYGKLAETFHYLGLLPAPDSEGYEDPEQDIPMFEADKTVTREYAAYTVAKAMGFDGEIMLDCADAADITYKNEVGILLQQGYFMLNESYAFQPSAPLTGTDKIRVFSRIDAFNDSLTVEEDEIKDEIVMQSDVTAVESSEYTITDNQDGTYTVTVPYQDDLSAMAEGEVFTLSNPETGGTEFALKVQDRTEQEGALALLCVEPEIEEVVKEFDFAGYATADISGMTVTEGVTAEYDPNGAVVLGNDDELEPFNLGGSTALPGTLKYKLYEKEIGNTGVTVSGDFEFEIPDITAKAKGKVFGGFSMDELTVSVTSKFKTTGSVEYDFGIPESGFDVTTGNPTFGTGKIELGRIPVKLGATGLSLDFVLFLNVDVSGKASISYTLQNTNGFQYKDGAFRVIKDYTSQFEALELNGSAKLGMGIAVNVSLFSVFDLAGFDAHAGLGISVKFTAHSDVDPALYCGDATVYLYAVMELNEDTIIVDFMDRVFRISWSWDIFDEDSSPLKRKLHIENGKKVDECTYGKGHIHGLVKSAETGESIGGAKIKVYNASTNALVQTVQTQQIPLLLSGFQLYRGEFLVQNLPVGTYRLEVVATGYKAYNIMVDVLADQRVECEAALMLLRDDMTGPGTVSGNITNALTNQPLSGTSYAVRSGWNTLDGEAVMSGEFAESNYFLELEAGNYTLALSKSDFVNTFVNIVVSSGRQTVKDIAVSPTAGIEIGSSSFRAVLTWGEYPYDLDSHMYHRNDNGSSGFHTWYADKDYYENGSLTANLDVDDVTSYGPETSTVYTMEQDGVYSFYVHDYTNRDSNSSTQMSNSGAQVKIYSGEVLVATFVIPPNREGTLWHVFDYNAASGEFTYVNEFSYAVAG